MNESWKYVKELKNLNAISEFEMQYGVRFPSDLKECILKNNGGRPQKSVIDTNLSKERMFKSLLSFNSEDKENIFTIYEVLQKEDKSLLPFASDPSGNYFCIKADKVVLWLHESGKLEIVANSFTELIENLN